MLIRISPVFDAVRCIFEQLHVYITAAKALKKTSLLTGLVLASLLVTTACSTTPNTMASTTLQDMRFKYKHLRYVSDQEQFGMADYWQTPSETKQNKKYDCEDISFLYYFELLKQGHKPQLLYGVFPDGQAHVAVALHGWVLDGNSVYKEEHINFNVIYTFTHESVTLPTPPQFFKRYTLRLNNKDRGFATTEKQFLQETLSNATSKSIVNSVANSGINLPPLKEPGSP